MTDIGGYDVECIQAVSSSYECSICHFILRKPKQTACGHRFCCDCLNACFTKNGENSECPIDREIINHEKVFDDKAFERDILNIKVKCTNSIKDCGWTGELRYLEDHWNNCQRFPLSCSNRCGETKLPRKEMLEHLSKCPLTVVTCSFTDVGCSVQFPRGSEDDHMQSYMKKHLNLLASRMINVDKTCQEQKIVIDKQNRIIADLKGQIRTLQYSQANSFVMKIENFEEKMELERSTGKSVFSEPHIIDCYKLRLEIYLNGQCTAKGTHLSIFFHLMKGHFDDCLSWPFTKPIKLSLMHPKNKKNYEKIIEIPNYDDFDSFQKPDNDGADDSIGYREFISHESLYANGYLKEDNLFIRCEIGR